MIAEVPEPGSRVSDVLSLNRDLARISEWFKRWRILVNPVKNKALVIFSMRSLSPIFLHLLLEESVVEVVEELKVLAKVLDT